MPRVSLLQRGTEGGALRAPGGGGSSQRRPNIVLFLPDDMYISDFAPWQEDNNIAPPVPEDIPRGSIPIPLTGDFAANMNRVAQLGATFTNAYSTSSSCTPSRFSILTGRLPGSSQYGQEWSESFLGSTKATWVSPQVSEFGDRDNQNNVARALQSLGYTTGMVGKWHLAAGASFDTPYTSQTQQVQKAGFDYVDGLYITNLDDEGGESLSHNMEWVMERALNFMDSAIRTELPFFLYCNPTLPHYPPKFSVEMFDDEVMRTTPAGILSRLPDISQYCSSCSMASREAVWEASSISGDETLRFKFAGLRWVDESLGVLYDFLSEKGAIGNTYIVVSTDHGSAKGTLYELGIRVPLYAFGPGIPAGHWVTDLVSHVDMAPTFLEWAGCCSQDSFPIPVDGLSWSSLASAKASSLGRAQVYAESMLDRATVTKDRMKYITRYDFEAVLANGRIDASKSNQVRINAFNMANFESAYPSCHSGEQVYDLSVDPSEQTNLVVAGPPFGA